MSRKSKRLVWPKLAAISALRRRLSRGKKRKRLLVKQLIQRKLENPVLRIPRKRRRRPPQAKPSRRLNSRLRRRKPRKRGLRKKLKRLRLQG